MKKGKWVVVFFSFVILVTSVPVYSEMGIPDDAGFCSTLYGGGAEAVGAMESPQHNSEQVISKIANECNILSFVDEDVFRESKPIERLPDHENLNSYVFLNEDGTQTMYVMNENVKYIAEDGSIREKNIELVRDKGRFVTKENDILVSISENPAEGIALSRDHEKQIVLIPCTQDINRIVSIVKQDQDSERSIRYPNLFGSGIDLRYVTMLSGAKEEIILDSYTGVNTFTFLLRTNGLSVYKSGEQYYLAESENAEVRTYLKDAVIYDRMGKSVQEHLLIEESRAGSEYILTVEADENYLTDSETDYPVTIDLSITISDPASGANSIEDAPVFQNKPTANFGSFQFNTIGQGDTNYGVGRTVVKLTGLLNNVAFMELTPNQVVSAFFYVHEATGNAAKSVNIYRIKDFVNWDESTVTWNNYGSIDTYRNWGGVLYSNSWSSFNITTLVKGWIDGSYIKNGAFVMTMSGTESASFKQIDSSESVYDYKPYVKLTFSGVFPSGIYCIQNKESGKVIDLAGSSSAEGTEVMPRTFHGEKNQRWKITRATEGAYSIQNTASGLFLGVEMAVSSGSAVKQYTRSQSNIDKTLWYIDPTPSGGYRISSKAGGTAMYYIIGQSGDSAIRQYVYIDNDEYSDEWLMHKSSGTIKIDIMYDHAYNERFPDAVSRIDSHMDSLKMKFLTEFGIWIYTDSITLISSYADINCSAKPNTPCTHASDADCRASVYLENGKIHYETYHHTNLINNLIRIEAPDIEKSVRMVFFGNVHCSSDANGRHVSNAAGLGGTYSSRGLIGIAGHNSKEIEYKIVVHELGHMYQVKDHVNDPSSDATCIYGRGQMGLIEPTICQKCRAVISGYAPRFSHDG